MKFTISVEILASYVNIVSKVVTNKSNLPILNNLKLEATKDIVTITGTNLETQISAQFKIPVDKEGRTSVNAKLFSQYLTTLNKDDVLNIELKDNNLIVKGKNSLATFTTQDPSDFPVFDEEKYFKLFKIEPDKFAKMLNKTSFACAKDEIRPILTGILFEVSQNELTMVGLDTYRLSKIESEIINKIKDKKSFVVNALSLENISKILKDQFIASITEDTDVVISLSEAENFITLDYGPICVKTRLLDGTYPDYKKILPTEYNLEMKVSVSEVLNSLRRVAVFAQNAIGQKVYWTITKDKMILESMVPEIGQVKETIGIETSKFEGLNKEGSLKMAFQLRFLLDILNNIDDEYFIFRGIDSNSPAIFKDPSIESFIHLLMPLRITE